jgi:hypothetical protein
VGTPLLLIVVGVEQAAFIGNRLHCGPFDFGQLVRIDGHSFVLRCEQVETNKQKSEAVIYQIDRLMQWA